MSATPSWPTPPPDHPLDEISRARIRARVVAGLDSTTTGPSRSWRAPTAAAAAVLVVGTMAGVVAVKSDSEPRTSSQPTTGPSPDKLPSASVSTTDPRGAQLVTAPKQCGSEVQDVLDAAEPAVAFELPSGSPAAFYVRGDRWSLCDERAGIVTVSQPLRFDERFANRARPFRVSSNLYDPGGAQDVAASFLAGGPAPDGAEDFFDLMTYTFPDGTVIEADLVTDAGGRTWWYVEYVATDGPMIDPKTNVTKLDPIVVELGLSGVAYEMELAWLDDTCAQANHGC